MKKVSYMVMVLTAIMLLGTFGAVLPVATAQSGIDLTDESEIALESMNVELYPAGSDYGTNGQASYNVTVSGEVKTDGLPLLYPVRLTFYDVSDYSGANTKGALESSNDAESLEQETTVLSPTNPDSFVPTIRESETEDERIMTRDLNINLVFPDLLEQDTAEKDVVVIAESIRSDNVASTTDTVNIDGSLPSGTDSSTVQESNDVNILTDVSFVDSYRVSGQNEDAQFGENLELPSPSDYSLSGEISGFNGMSSAFGNSTVVSGDNNISMVTKTGDIPNGRPYTLTITYDISEGDGVDVRPMNPVGQDITENSEYRLPADPSEEDYCQEIDAEGGTLNMCNIYLNEGEVDLTGTLKELLLHYRSDDSTTISISCQSVISGYLPNNRQSCGVNPAEGDPDPPISNAVIDAQGLAGEPDPDDPQWTSPEVPVIRNDEQSVDHNLRFDVRETISGSFNSGDHVVKVFREDEHVGSDGEILSSATPVYEESVSNYDGENWNEHVVSDQPASDLPREYHFILCASGSTVPNSCGIETNVGHDVLTFNRPINNDVSLDVKSPVVINPLDIQNVREDEVEVRTETLEIPDADYDTRYPAWDIQNDGDPIINGFDGTVRQEVTVQGVYEDKADRAQNGEILQEALDRRSDAIPDSEWDYEVSVTRTDYRDMVVPSSANIEDYVSFTDGWTQAGLTDPRSVQVDTEQQNFPIVNGDSFATRVEGQEQWYPLRNADSDRPETEFVFDTRLQRTDPDRCLNCLTTETREDANARLGSSQGGLTEAVGTSELVNAWERASEEPTIVNGQEVSSRFFRRSDVVSNTMTYNNIDVPTDSRFKYRQRESEKESIELYEYEYAPTIVEPLFERPVTEQIDRYTRHRYDITYTFSADVQNEDIYRYEKTVRDDIIEYQDRHVAWVDLSRSSPSEDINQFEVQFEGADQPISVDWIEGIHSEPPGERDTAIQSMCDGSPESIDGQIDDEFPVSKGLTDPAFSELERLDGLYQGNGGTPVVQRCDINGEEKIVRVGQEYDETGIFSYDVRLISNNEQDQGVVEVIGENPDGDGGEEPQIGSEPEISDVTAVNDKVDYRIGTVPITGQVTSQTNNLDSNYELTVTPADNIGASSVSCSELGGGYRSVMNKSLTNSYPSGASFRQVEKCRASEFENPSQAPERFELFRTYGSISVDPTSFIIEASEVPAGAVQRCIDPFSENSGDCVATISNPISQTNTFEYQNPDGSYQSIETVEAFSSLLYQGVEAPGIGYQCPAGYEMTREQQQADDRDSYSTTDVRYCQLENPDALSIDLRSRTVIYQFESVDQGIVTECSDIPTVGQDGNHDGYTDGSAPSETAECVLQGDGQGPSGFTLYTTSTDSATGDSDVNYNSLPAGAFRGKSFVTGEEAAQCQEVTIENDGAMICEYDTGDEIVDVRFGNRDLGEWTSSSDTVSDLLDQTNARKAIWQGENIAPQSPDDYTEDFTTTINPRNTGITVDQRDVEFTVELRDKVTGDIEQTETVEVRLCAADQIEDRTELPRDERGSYECEDFDTMMTGENDFQGTMSVSDAVEEYQSQGLDGRTEEYTITAAQNDACAYTHEFPRDQSTLLENTGPYTFEIQANNPSELQDEEERMNEELENVLAAQYSPLGEDPCERVEGDFDIPTFVDNPEDFSIEFNKRTFADEESTRFTRIAGLEDLHKIVPNPVQNRWTKDDLGSAVRLGHPVLLKDSSSALGQAYGQEPQQFAVNDGLVAHYTFDHNANKDYVSTSHSYGRLESVDRITMSTVPNHYVIQDVGMKPVIEAPDGRETGYQIDSLTQDEYTSKGIYNARLWYASPCHATDRYADGAVYNPEAIQPINNSLGPRLNSHAFNTDPCEDLLTSSEAEAQIAGKQYDTNGQASFYRQFNAGFAIIPELAATADRLEERALSDQSAFLPVPPTKDWEDEYDSTGRITDAYEAVNDNYAEQRGAFGGNALRLDKTSWMMITPPCHDKDTIGDQLGADINDRILTGNVQSCDPDEDLDESQWRGGWQDAYTNPDAQLEQSSIHDEIEDEYTITFWVNTQAERESMSEVTASDGSSVAPLRSLYSTSNPVQYPAFSLATNSNIMPSTSELSLVRAPSYISIADLPQEAKDSSDKLSGDRVKPLSWDYPGHYTLRDTARACMASSGSGSDTLLGPDSRPVMCEVFEASNSEHAGEYDDLTQYEDETPNNLVDAAPFLEDFRKEMIDRTVWEPRLDWPVGDSVQRGGEGFPAFNRSDEFGDGEEYGDIIACYYATQRQDAINGNECYDTGRYAYSDHSDLSNIQADNGFGNSDWQHVAITYERDSSGLRDFEIKINGELQGTPAGDELELNEAQELDDVKVGELYDGAVMSLGAVYQDPGYNMDPDDLAADYTDDNARFVPYVHASQGEVLIDEVRMYNRELTAEEIDSRLPTPVAPSEHGLPADVPMYTGRLETEPEYSIPNGTLISNLLDQDDYRTFEVSVDAASEGPAAYKIDIIPCLSSDNCLRDAAVTVSEANIPDEESSSTSGVSDISGGSDSEGLALDGALGSAGTEHLDVQLTGVSEVVRFSGEDLTNDQLQDISAFKLDMKLGTPYVDSSPVIRNVELTPAGDPFSSCQKIGENHPGAQGLYGSEFDATILDSSGIVTDAKCDMKRAGGDWTRFAWVDTSDGDSFSRDIESGDPMFKEDTRLSDCDEDEDDVCFSAANWDDEVLDNVDSDTGPYPQVMIKAVDQNQVVDWATFQFSEDAHEVIEDEYGVDNIRVAGTLARLFSGDATGTVTGSGPYNSAGQPLTGAEPTASGDPLGMYDECLHPFDNSGDFNRRCISHTKQVESGNQLLYMSEMTITGFDPLFSGFEYGDNEMLRIERNYEENKIESMSCLGRNVDKCEFYFRTGDNFDPLTQRNGISNLRGVFDLEDYSLEEREDGPVADPIEPQAFSARGYTFEPLAETRIYSLYSSYQSGVDNDAWIGLYEVNGDQLGTLLASSGISDGNFNENRISPADPITVSPNQKYAIVQSAGSFEEDNTFIGYDSGSSFDAAAATSENPIKSFSPIGDGQAFAVSENSGSYVGYTGDNPSAVEGNYLNTDVAGVTGKAPRLGYSYEVLAGNVNQIEFEPAVGFISKVRASDDRVSEVLDLNSRGIYEQLGGNGERLEIAPNRRGSGVYYGQDDGKIVHVEDDDYGNTEAPDYDSSDSEVEVVADASDVVTPSGIEELEISQDGETAYIHSGPFLAAYDTVSGDQIWNKNTGNLPGGSAIGASQPIGMEVEDDYMYAVTPIAKVYQLNKSTGDSMHNVNLDIPDKNQGDSTRQGGQEVHDFDVSEETGKVVLATAGTPLPLDMRLEDLRNGNADYELYNDPVSAMQFDEFGYEPDDAEVAITDDGRVAVWMGLSRDTAMDGGDVRHGITTFDTDDRQELGSFETTFVPSNNQIDNQPILDMDVSPSGDVIAAGTDGGDSVGALRTFQTNNVDEIYEINTYNGVDEVEVYGRVPGSSPIEQG